MKNKYYNIRLLGQKAICPACNGMLVFQNEETGYLCRDCRVRIIPVGEGITDREIKCEIIGLNKGMVHPC